MPTLLTPDDLKRWLHQGVGRQDKLLLVWLGSFDAPCQIHDIKLRAREAGLQIPPKWNLSSLLARSGGLAIRTPRGWELADSGKQRLRTLGVAKISAAAVQVATDLRLLLGSIHDAETRAFAEEAIRCYEGQCYRSAVVMSWLAAVDIMRKVVHDKHLAEFNIEASRVNAAWKNAKTPDDLGNMKEAEFLDRLASLSMIGKNVKDQLQHCLRTRNGCGHPNSLKIGPNAAAHHLEILLQNVFQRFC